MNTKINKKYLYNYITLVAAVLLCFSLIRGYAISSKQLKNLPSSGYADSSVSVLTSLNEGWTLQYENGDTEEISLPFEVSSDTSMVSISKSVSGPLKDGNIIMFDNNRQGVSVSVNSEVIYEVNTTNLTKQLSFTDYQLVPLPALTAEESTELTLRFTHKITDHYQLPAISYGPYQAASNEIVRNDILTLCILVILSLILLIALFISVFCYINKISVNRIVDLILFLIAAILWGLTDSYLPVLLHLPQEVLGLICYFSIMILPLPICQFVWRCCNHEYRVLPTISFIGIINLILQIVFSSLGFIQLQYTFASAHILIVAMIISSLFCIYKTRKSQQSKEIDVLYFGIVALAFIALLSLVLYWQKGGMYYRICLLIGVLFFSVVICAYVIIHYVRIIHRTQLEISEIKIHERLSLQDSMTGLPNRRAFETRLDEIEHAQPAIEDALLIMLDVNGLKIVNDQFGHNAGDDLIISASRVIQMTYGIQGSCYRIGGDEFAVILEDFSIPLTTFDQLFDENIEQFNENSHWKLSIAKGCSHLCRPSGQRLTISDWKQEADINMYRNKVSMTKGHTRDRAKDLTEIINCVITTVEAKDVYTAAHSDRVRKLSSCIAQHLGVSASTMQNIETAASLHDIGKIGIPDYVLLKPGRLTDEEYEIIKQHSMIGANIIGQAKGMLEISGIILHHHERWDGKGYPEGLSREDIPIESRIIAIADSIDAMTSRRVYRESLSLDHCRQEIERNSGIMYDPAITQIVLQNWSDIVDIILLHPKRLIRET